MSADEPRTQPPGPHMKAVRARAEARARDANQTFGPRVRELYVFLERLAAELNAAEPQVEAFYQLNGYGVFSELRQRDYRVVREDADSLRKFSLLFNCQGDGALKLTAKTREELEDVKEYLSNYRLNFRCSGQTDFCYPIYIEPSIPVALTFEVEPTQGIVKFTAKNLPALGITTYYLDMERIEQELIEELGKRVKREPDRFDALTGHKVSNTTRRNLKQAIAARRQERQSELKGSGVLAQRLHSHLPFKKFLFRVFG